MDWKRGKSQSQGNLCSTGRCIKKAEIIIRKGFQLAFYWLLWQRVVPLSIFTTADWMMVEGHFGFSNILNKLNKIPALVSCFWLIMKEKMGRGKESNILSIHQSIKWSPRGMQGETSTQSTLFTTRWEQGWSMKFSVRHQKLQSQQTRIIFP